MDEPRLTQAAAAGCAPGPATGGGFAYCEHTFPLPYRPA